MILVERFGDSLKLTHDFQPAEIVALRQLPVRRFDPDLKAWLAPPAPKNVDMLRLWADEKKAVVTAEAEELIVNRERNKSHDPALAELPAGFTFVTKSRPYQLDALRFLRGRPHAGLSLPPGSGKTKLYIEDLECSVLEKLIEGAIFFCPNSIKKNLPDELKAHGCMDFDLQIYKPSKKETIRKWILMPSKKPKLLVMATESLSSGDGFEIAVKFLASGKFGLYLDESHFIKTHSAERTKKMLKLAELAPVTRIGTGTMILKGLVNAWAQMQVVSKDIFQQSFFAFRNRYAKMGGYKAKQVVGDQNADEFFELVRPFIYCRTKDDILSDLPEKIHQRRFVEMTTEQRRLYEGLKTQGLVRTENGEVSYTNALTRELRLQQITGGFIGGELLGVDQNGVHFKTEASAIPGKNPKFDEVLQVLEDHEGKVVIWCRFIPEILGLENVLRERGIRCVKFVGQGMKDDDREAAKVAFRDDPEIRVFLGQIRTGGTGLNGLQVAQVSVYLSNDFSLVSRIQSEDRTHRIGQEGMDIDGEHGILYIDILTEDGNDNEVHDALMRGVDYTKVIQERMKTA